ncbi:PLP-dependent transferase [Pholiota conissans]|uniref:alanine--glyoxylate transaminase n=1 Tax=Pholiota conissans TaxID=109636 RepID=A0A9P5Z131_9AGAR|nr:PLP-dependent transferase [Pholiota conissans]
MSSCPVAAAAAQQKLLAIPGPIQLSPAVQQTLALPPLSHVSPEFVQVFQESLKMTRQIVGASPASAALLLAGSGTLGWDQVGANLIEQGDRALVLHTGYFGDGFRECLETYGAKTTTLRAPLGGTVPLADVERALLRSSQDRFKYKMVTITHVDTSTGVLSDVRAIAACVRRASPGTLVVVDAVCSLASEEVQMDAWGVDVVLSASQKGLGAPPGLSVLVASPHAVQVWQERKARGVKSGSFYSSWEKWMPIMQAYDAGKPAYFGTPAVSIVRAYHASLREITTGPISLTARIALHAAASAKITAAAAALGLRPLAPNPHERAHGMTALYVPVDAAGRDKVKAAAVLGAVSRRGVVMAGGLVSEGGVKERYIRIGHMGWSVVGDGGKDVDRMIRVLQEAVLEEVEKAEREARGVGCSLIKPSREPHLKTSPFLATYSMECVRTAPSLRSLLSVEPENILFFVPETPLPGKIVGRHRWAALMSAEAFDNQFSGYDKVVVTPGITLSNGAKSSGHSTIQTDPLNPYVTAIGHQKDLQRLHIPCSYSISFSKVFCTPSTIQISNRPSMIPERSKAAKIATPMCCAVVCGISSRRAWAKCQAWIETILTSLLHYRLGDARIALLVVEMKQELGAGACDPILQAGLSMRRIWIDSLRMRHVYCTGYRPDTSDDGTMDEEAPSTKVVVKFIARYGKEAHELLAREGYAPRLPYYGPVSRTPLSGVLPGPAERSSPGLCLRSDLTYMVVMDYVEASSKIPSDARQQISSALKLLHPKGYIFGDLREQNVLFDSAGKVKFIKFKRSKAFGNLTPISALSGYPQPQQPSPSIPVTAI